MVKAGQVLSTNSRDLACSSFFGFHSAFKRSWRAHIRALGQESRELTEGVDGFVDVPSAQEQVDSGIQGLGLNIPGRRGGIVLLGDYRLQTLHTSSEFGVLLAKALERPLDLVQEFGGGRGLLELFFQLLEVVDRASSADVVDSKPALARASASAFFRPSISLDTASKHAA